MWATCGKQIDIMFRAIRPFDLSALQQCCHCASHGSTSFSPLYAIDLWDIDKHLQRSELLEIRIDIACIQGHGLCLTCWPIMQYSDLLSFSSAKRRSDAPYPPLPQIPTQTSLLLTPSCPAVPTSPIQPACSSPRSPLLRTLHPGWRRPIQHPSVPFL